MGGENYNYSWLIIDFFKNWINQTGLQDHDVMQRSIRVVVTNQIARISCLMYRLLVQQQLTSTVTWGREHLYWHFSRPLHSIAPLCKSSSFAPLDSPRYCPSSIVESDVHIDLLTTTKPRIHCYATLKLFRQKCWACEYMKLG